MAGGGGENHVRFAKPVSVAGWSQALAIEYGEGRVVILGKAFPLWVVQAFLNLRESSTENFQVFGSQNISVFALRYSKCCWLFLMIFQVLIQLKH